MELTKKSLLYIFLLAIVLYVTQVIFFTSSKNIETKLFTINKGETVKKIALDLKDNNLIENPYIFITYTAILGKYSKIQAGEYLLSTQMSLYTIVDILTKGEIAKEAITILEGWDLRDLNNYLKEKKIAEEEYLFGLTGTPTATEKNQNVENLSKKFDFLKDKPTNLSLEGYLFPDTYYINKGDNAEEIIERALSNFNSKLNQELRDEIKKQKKTIFEIITMASMIEKEVKTLNDKKMVSGILWKRMEIGMRLQVDATILYATGQENSKVYIKDTQFDSPYNTYRHDGLPLGPISNPGIDSIVAAIYPTKTNNLYYLSTPDGQTIFSKTLEEHNYNKNKYLK